MKMEPGTEKFDFSSAKTVLEKYLAEFQGHQEQSGKERCAETREVAKPSSKSSP